MSAPKLPEQIACRFNDYAEPTRERLLTVRDVIFAVAQCTPEVGPIHETLKWNQPSYLTQQTRAGTTLRLGVSNSGSPTLFVHCQTTIVSEFQDQFAQDVSFEGGRGIHLTDETPDHVLRMFIRRALTYHLGKA